MSLLLAALAAAAAAGQLGFAGFEPAASLLGVCCFAGLLGGAIPMRKSSGAGEAIAPDASFSTASYVGHELRNTLTAASLHAEMLSASEGAAGERAKDLGAIREALRHALALSERLSGGPRRQRPTVPDAAAALRSCSELVRPLVERVGTLQTELPASLAPVALDEAEFGELVINLLVNAGEALEEGGTVKLAARGLEAPPRVAIDVVDDGCGMSEQLLDHVFEAGFSRKSGGTGLGLARVAQIVEKCAGTVRVSSAPGRGAAFHVELPAESRAGDQERC